MSGQKYYINITNKCKETKFSLFHEIPEVDRLPESSGKLEVLSSFFWTSDTVAAASDGSSTVEFMIENTFYTFHGTKSGQGASTKITVDGGFSGLDRAELAEGGFPGTAVRVTNQNGSLK